MEGVYPGRLAPPRTTLRLQSLLLTPGCSRAMPSAYEGKQGINPSGLNASRRPVPGRLVHAEADLAELDPAERVDIINRNDRAQLIESYTEAIDNWAHVHSHSERTQIARDEWQRANGSSIWLDASLAEVTMRARHS